MTEFVRHRLRSHRLDGTAFAQPSEVVAWFGAMQAQDYPHARWAVGLRCAGATDISVRRAIADRSIIRTWAMRGTLQLVAAQDARWLVELVGPRLAARAAAGDVRRFGLDDAEFARAVKVLEKALRGAPLTRADALAALERHAVSTAGQRGYHILARAALSGHVCLGPMRGKQDTFVLLDEWLPPVRPVPRDAALAELALRYFRSHGPATLRDFAWWSGLTANEARAGLAGAESRLIREAFGGAAHWLSDDAPHARATSPGALLLPGFDEYVLGYADRGAVLGHIEKAEVIHSNGVFRPTIVVDGRVVGTWTRQSQAGRLAVTPALHAPVTRRAQRAIVAAAAAYKRFMEAPQAQPV